VWINDLLPTPFQSFRIKEGQLLFEYERTMERIENGDCLPREIMKKGELTSEASAIIRDILYSNPKIWYKSFLQLYNQFASLFLGRALREDEFPSISTIQSHIAQLDNYDRHDVSQSIKKFTENSSPRGNRVFFGGGGDGTCHGKADKREVCMIALSNNEFHDESNPYKIDPSFFVTTAASPVGSDSNANAQHYLDSMERVVPPESLASLLAFSIDNCTTAKKDGRLTMEGVQKRAIHHGQIDKTTAHGVTIRGFTIGDFFHRHQLSVKWFSETACGQTEKGCHEQIHHRQVSQRSLHTNIDIRALTFALVAGWLLYRLFKQIGISISEMLKCT